MYELTKFPARGVFVSARAFLTSLIVGLFLAALVCLPVVAQEKKVDGKKDAVGKKDAAEKKDVVAQEDLEEAEQPAAKPAAKTPAPVVKDYTVIKVDDSLKASASKVSQALRRGFAAGDAELFDKVCDNYVLPMWTQPANLPEVAGMRQKLKGQLLTAKNAATRDHFNKHLLDVLPKMASGNYHPAVRYNCMLLIGELDLTPPPSIRDLAVPLPDALPILLDALADANQLEAVKVAALVGIGRHSRSLPSNDARRKVTDALLELAKAKNDPKTSPMGHAWMRCMAIDTLGEMKSVGDKSAIAKALLEIVDDAEAPLSVRSAAAEAIGKLDYSKQEGLNPGAMVRQLGRLAMAACQTELDECKEKNRTISPRILKCRLSAVRMGLMGTKDLRVEEAAGGAMRLLQKPEEKKNAAAIRQQIDRWLGTLDDPRLLKKIEPEQEPGGGMPGPGGRPGMGGEMGLGMRPGMGRDMGPGGMGGGMPEEQDEMKIASDEIIAKIAEELKSFAALVQ